MKSLLITGFLIICTISATSQQYVFAPLKDRPGKKDSFLTGVDKRYREDLARLSGQHKKDLSQIYKYRYEMIREKFESGEVLTDQKSQEYLNRILQEILRANTLDQPSNLRLAFSRNWWANASSMGEGTIVFNIGLFHRLNNEAQAAFVICHELAHFYLDHSNDRIHKHINTFKSDEVQKKIKEIEKSKYGQNRQAEALLTKLTLTSRKHSREDEAAADSMALVLMKNTRYDLNEALTCLALLDSSDKEKHFVPLDLSQKLNFKDYPFKKNWLQSSAIRFSAEKDEKAGALADSLKTHPDCSVRIARLSKEVAGVSKPSQKFVVSEEIFRELQKQFDYEIIHYTFQQERISYCLYLVLNMLEHMPDDPYLNTMAGKCLNELYAKQKAHELGKIADRPGPDTPEDYNKLLQLIQNVRLQELAAITYHFLLEKASLFENNANYMKEFVTSKNNYLK